MRRPIIVKLTFLDALYIYCIFGNLVALGYSLALNQSDYVAWGSSLVWCLIAFFERRKDLVKAFFVGEKARECAERVQVVSERQGLRRGMLAGQR